MDYRAFLADWCGEQRKMRTGFSLRYLSGKLGLQGTSFLSAVLKGKKNLGDDLRVRLAKIMDLQGDCETYFHTLVQFNQVKDMENKNYWFRQLSRFRSSRAQLVGEGQFRFYSKWYYAAIWNWVAMHPGQGSPVRIAGALLPSITVEQAQTALQDLVEMGLLRKLANGYRPEGTHLTTEPEVSSLAVKNHILELNDIAARLLDSVPACRRQYNTLMFQVSEKGFVAIKDRIRQFQEELRDILDRDKGEDRIYTLSMNLFPNSRLPGEND